MREIDELKIVFQNTASFKNPAKINPIYKSPERNRTYTRKA
jgi:hypothetical protein